MVTLEAASRKLSNVGGLLLGLSILQFGNIAGILGIVVGSRLVCCSATPQQRREGEAAETSNSRLSAGALLPCRARAGSNSPLRRRRPQDCASARLPSLRLPGPMPQFHCPLHRRPHHVHRAHTPSHATKCPLRRRRLHQVHRGGLHVLRVLLGLRRRRPG